MVNIVACSLVKLSWLPVAELASTFIQTPLSKGEDSGYTFQPFPWVSVTINKEFLISLSI